MSSVWMLLVAVVAADREVRVMPYNWVSLADDDGWLPPWFHYLRLGADRLVLSSSK